MFGGYIQNYTRSFFVLFWVIVCGVGFLLLFLCFGGVGVGVVWDWGLGLLGWYRLLTCESPKI